MFQRLDFFLDPSLFFFFSLESRETVERVTWTRNWKSLISIPFVLTRVFERILREIFEGGVFSFCILIFESFDGKILFK